MFVTIIDVFTLIVSTVCFGYAAKRLNQEAKFFVYFLFFAIMVLPLYLDYLIGKPDYLSWPLGRVDYGFILSYDDSLTRIICDLILLGSQLVLLGIKGGRRESSSVLDWLTPGQLGSLKIVIGIAAFLPVVLTVLLPLDNRMLVTWGWRDAGLFSFDQGLYYKMEKLSYIGIAASILMLYLNRKHITNLENIIWVVLAYMNICLEAKRSILIFTAVLLLAFAVGHMQKKDLPKLFTGVLVVAIAVIALSVFVKTQYRGYGDSGFAAIYGNLRVDYFRDDTVKMLIYSVMHPEVVNVLDYPFQSYIMQIGYIFPLDFLSLDRLGYNTYFTCALVHQPISSGLSYTTTSCMDELIANFGYVGMVLIPIFLLAISRLADRQPYELKALVYSALVLLMMYSMNYIMWYLEAIVVIMVLCRFSMKNFNERKGKRKWQ